MPVIWQPAKVATPELALSGLVVQASVPDDEVSVIEAEEPVTTLPPESSTLTTGWVEKAAPLVADDGEADVVDGDGFAEDGAAREEQLGRFEAEDDNATVVDQVVGVDEAAFVHGDEADGGEVGLDAHDLSRGVGEGADGVEVASVEQGGDGAQLGEGTQIGFVAEGELVGPHAGVLVSDSGDRAVPHHDDVVAEGGEVAMLTGAEALPEADQDEQRAYPPGNAKHGEEGAQLVGQHGAEDLAESVRKILHR